MRYAETLFLFQLQLKILKQRFIPTVRKFEFRHTWIRQLYWKLKGQFHKNLPIDQQQLIKFFAVKVTKKITVCNKILYIASLMKNGVSIFNLLLQEIIASKICRGLWTSWFISHVSGSVSAGLVLAEQSWPAALQIPHMKTDLLNC